MARTKTYTQNDTITTTSWRNRHLEKLYVCVFRLKTLYSHRKQRKIHTSITFSEISHEHAVSKKLISLASVKRRPQSDTLTNIINCFMECLFRNTCLETMQVSLFLIENTLHSFCKNARKGQYFTIENDMVIDKSKVIFIFCILSIIMSHKLFTYI